ncbi:MAG: SRPBCC family protein [Actinomycetota bacterium]|nr:SRPBCC family protein [Actinomycetota bacterium]
MDDVDLRFADHPTAETSIDIAAPPDTVFALVADISLPARFSRELVGAEWLDGATGPALGARFVGRNEHPRVGAWETTSTIVELEPDRRLAWAVGDTANPGTTWRFTLEPIEGGTRLTQWMQIGPGPSGINSVIAAMPDKESRIIHRRLAEHRASMEANLAGIKTLAEE